MSVLIAVKEQNGLREVLSDKPELVIGKGIILNQFFAEESYHIRKAGLVDGHQVKGALDDDHRVKLAGDPVKVEKDFGLHEAWRQQPLRIVRRDLFHRPARVADQFPVPTMDRKDNPSFHQALAAKAQAEDAEWFPQQCAAPQKTDDPPRGS